MKLLLAKSPISTASKYQVMIRESAEFSEEEEPMITSSLQDQRLQDLKLREQLNIDPIINDYLQRKRQKMDKTLYKRTIKSCKKVYDVGFHDW